jgi:hypothetical protein
MFVLTSQMVYAVFGLYKLSCVGADVQRLELRAQLVRFHLKMDTESSLPNVVCFQ